MKKLKTEIYSLAFGAEGVGKVDGKVCFVRDALPGEEVIFEVVKETPKYIRGELVEILVRSPERIRPDCSYYGECGGCQLQHISYEKELTHKRQQAIDLVRRVAGIKDFECGEVVPSPTCYNYRSGITLHRNAGGRYGFIARDGRTIIEISNCLLAEDGINKALSEISAEGKKTRVTLKADHKGRVWVSDRQGERFFQDRIRDTDIFLSPKAFSQCNRYIAGEISRTLDEWMGMCDENTAFFDVYCGSGFFCFTTRKEFGIKIGIDAERTLIDCAKTTVKTNGLTGIRFYRGEAEKEFFHLFKKNRKDRNILLIDPPRKGVERNFLEGVKSTEGIDRVFYISCDPARLARDMKIMTEAGGWSLGRFKLFDMFPRTKHIEVLAEFVPREPRIS